MPRDVPLSHRLEFAALLGAQSTNILEIAALLVLKSIGLFVLQGYIFEILGQHTLTQENVRGIKVCNGHVKHYIGYIEIFSWNLICNPKIWIITFSPMLQVGYNLLVGGIPDAVQFWT